MAAAINVNTLKKSYDNSYFATGQIVSARKDGNTIYWYYGGSTSQASNQLNSSGTTYSDNNRYLLNDAATDSAKNYTWFFDNNGNLIGDKQIATVYTYGTITSMWWAEDNTTGGGKAMATVVYMDGTGETVELDTVDGNSLTYSITGAGVGSPMYVDSTNKVLYLAPYASTNYAADYDSANSKADALAGTAGTVKDGHLFRFLKDAATGKVTAEKVAARNMVDQRASTVSPKVSVIAGSIRTNDSTVYLIQKVGATATAAKTYESYTGFANIPALQNAVADAIDLDGDGYADYVYLTGDASVEVTATVTSGNVNVGVFGGVPTVLAAGSSTTATATGNLATGSYILVRVNDNYVAYLVG